MEEKRIAVVKACIRNEDGEFLIVRRSPEEAFFPDLWDFPGGKAEANESPEEALKRETVEETSLAVEEAAEMARYEMVEKGTPLEFIVFDTVLIPGDASINPQEYTEYKWASMTEALESKHTPFLDMYFSEFPDA
jgi:8-oxo-dGTP diphosphatase